MNRGRNVSGTPNEMLSDDLRDSKMMAHLLDALQEGTDIGEYGRLTFAIVARHFMNENEIADLLSSQPGFDTQTARAFCCRWQKRITTHLNENGY